MFKYLKNNFILVIVSFVLILLGIMCIMIRGDSIFLIFSILALVYLIVIGGWMIYSSFKFKDHLDQNTNFLNKSKGYLIQGIIMILAGILIISFPDFLVRLIIGIILIILPLITLIKHDDKKRYLKNNFWKFIVGLIFVLAFDIVLDILFIIIGSSLIILAGWIIYLLIINYNDKTYPNVISKYIMIYIVKKNNKFK